MQCSIEKDLIFYRSLYKRVNWFNVCNLGISMPIY